ncbi:MAG: TetR/AcrR family transcriptional regulator [Christensenellales bacterium]
MPKKPKFTRQEIIDAAYEIVKEDGKDNLVARSLAQKLNSACSPIFTLFESMEEVKQEVLNKAKATFVDYLKQSLSYFPVFKEFGLRYVRFAMENPNVFSMLFGAKNNVDFEDLSVDFADVVEPILEGIQKTFDLNRDESKYLCNHMIITANGMATAFAARKNKYGKEELGKYMSEACIGLVLILKTKGGKLDVDFAKRLANSLDKMPVKIDTQAK